jgi:tRNA threonylcarbamoyladenosine biosynthesis protein TsaE
MDTLILRSPDETFDLGAAWGREAAPGWVIGLTGELGAGKTQLVKGLAVGMGIKAKVHSPTFTLLNEYHGERLRLFHVDLYRLETPEAVLRAGLEDYVVWPEGVTAVEWYERFEGTGSAGGAGLARVGSGGRLRRVFFEALSETERRISYEDTRA